MKQSHNFWFPDYDTHFPKMLDKSLKKDGVLRYQWRARDAAVGLCKNKRICLDIGANVGLWSCELVEHFSNVIAFEPVAEFIECYKQNVKLTNYIIHNVALGNINSSIDMNIVQGNTGHSHIDESSIGKGSIPLRKLDDFKLTEVDLIKLDVEGFEEEIILGGKETILRNMPVIVVEQQKHEYKDAIKDTPSVKILESWGYKAVLNFKKDWILTFQGGAS